jgi:sialic acid synthase
MLRLFIPVRLKVASRDLTNLPLLEAMAETQIPMILSTGMTGKKELDDALEIITKYHSQISILHCLSQYPSEYQNINLLSIAYLKRHYPEFTIGYSDHSIGILMPPVAVAIGAEIIEKHITLDRNMKGTDHRGSLEPEGIWRMVRDIRNTEYAIGTDDFFASDKVDATRVKLERSIATLRSINSGEIITEDDLHMLSPGDGFKWVEREKLIGKKVIKHIAANEIIYPEMIEL